MPQVKPEIETFAKIKVVGVGGSGGSAVDRMVKEGIRGVDFVVMNTDVQALHHNSAAHKLHIGKSITRGLGAGMDPEMGKRSAEEAQNEIREMLQDTDMVFVTCGLGGGTGSGAGPEIAKIARELGALTVAVVTKPFSFEGPQRMKIAQEAHDRLAESVDTIITIPNDRVLQIIDKKTSLMDAFKIVDDVLRQGVQGISELITVPGLINVDFADVKTIMNNSGSALMGIGMGTGDNRAAEAAKSAIASPLLELSIDGARGILFTITGGVDLSMQEVSEAAKIVTSSADENAKVIFGAVIDEEMVSGEIRISVIATDFEASSRKRKTISTDDDAPVVRKKPVYSGGVFSKKRVETSVPKTEESPRPPSFFGQQPSQTSPPSPSSNRTYGAPVDDTDEDEKDDITPAAPSTPKPKNTDADSDDLEIPAFIRRKMGL